MLHYEGRSNLISEVGIFFKTQLQFYQNTRCHNPEDGNLQSRCFKNIKFKNLQCLYYYYYSLLVQSSLWHLILRFLIRVEHLFAMVQ